MPGGKVTPSSDVSNKDGIVIVKVTGGSETGNYVIIAKANDITQRATAIIKSS
jgi:hypothetical protein